MTTIIKADGRDWQGAENRVQAARTVELWRSWGIECRLRPGRAAGGLARARNLSAKRRSEIAREAAKARRES